ncbi:MAG: type I 3-dehydroquinate dehydratase [Candidatus Methanofastidiosa archaeon]|nr:type I 3-dehydroquinate dehydratase [Candidatus Methanofastidiosa archaeon]
MMLCSCIAESTMDGCLRAAATVTTTLVEHRIDYLEEEGDLRTLYNVIRQPVISTVRPVWEGGRSTVEDDEREAMLVKAMDAGCAAIDVELGTRQRIRGQLLRKARNASVLTILSHHDFSGTPSLPELEALLEEMARLQPDIVKIATLARTKGDGDIMARLMDARLDHDCALIAFCMGEAGIQSRIDALRLGAPFMYVSHGIATAPGQVGAQDMERLMGCQAV